MFNYLDFRFCLKHWDSNIRRLYFLINCGAHEHSSSAEWCSAIHMDIPYYQVKSKSSTMTSSFQVLVRNSLPTCIFCSHRSRINCSSWLHAENPTKHKIWCLNNTGSRPGQQCTRASDLSGSSLYLPNEICYKLQYVKHRHHYIHIIPDIITITKHRKLLEYSLRRLVKI